MTAEYFHGKSQPTSRRWALHFEPSVATLRTFMPLINHNSRKNNGVPLVSGRVIFDFSQAKSMVYKDVDMAEISKKNHFQIGVNNLARANFCRF